MEMVRSLLLLVLLASARATDPCQVDVMTCKMDQKGSGTQTPKTGGCMCARMSYVLATYAPSPDSGAGSLDTICNWWKLIQEFGKVAKVEGENFQQCIAVSRTMQSSVYYSSNGWVGANASCCSLFAPHSRRFRFREEASQLRAQAHDDVQGGSSRSVSHLARDNSMDESAPTPVHGAPIKTVEELGLVPPSWTNRTTGMPAMVPPNWVPRFKTMSRSGAATTSGDGIVDTAFGTESKEQQAARPAATAGASAHSFPDGVRLETEVEGDGESFPQPGDEVSVHYVGTLQDGGRQFDSSRDRGLPFKFHLGQGEVIKGWDLGVAGLSLGERAKLHLKPEFGYGAAGAGAEIPPNAGLDFDVELLAINGRGK